MSDETVTIATPDHGTLEFELAGLGSRFGAHFIDSVLLVGAVVGLALLLLGTGLLSGSDLDPIFDGGEQWAMSWSVALLLVLLFVVVWGYYVFFECVMRGSTPGKKQFGIRVIRDDGLPIGFRESALRNLVRAGDALPPPCYLLGGVVMFLDGHGRRLGDMVAGTLVVREKFEIESATAAGAAWAARVERGHSRQALTLPGGQITSAQVDLIEQFLARRFELQPDRRAALAWQIAAPLLALRGEEKEAWERRPTRTDECERFLLELVEMAKAPQRRTPGTAQPVATPGLFC
jgi:uncharacterized RDD family membrane protein YckC